MGESSWQVFSDANGQAVNYHDYSGDVEVVDVVDDVVDDVDDDDADDDDDDDASGKWRLNPLAMGTPSIVFPPSAHTEQLLLDTLYLWLDHPLFSQLSSAKSCWYRRPAHIQTRATLHCPGHQSRLGASNLVQDPFRSWC